MSEPSRPRREDTMTPEEKESVAITQRAAKHTKIREGRAAWREIYQVGLRAWQRELAEWIAVQPLETNWRQQAAIATNLAKTKITYSMIRALWAKTEFVDLVQRATTTAQGQARVIFENDMPFYMSSHRLGLEKVIENEEWTAIPKFTVPSAERLWPRGEHVQQNMQVNVAFSLRQLAREETPDIEVTATPIVPEKEDDAV